MWNQIVWCSHIRNPKSAIRNRLFMPVLTEDKRIIVPPPSRPDDGGRDGEGSGDSASSFPISKGQIGLWVLLTGIIMLFAGLSSAYIVLRGVPTWQNIAAAIAALAEYGSPDL